MKKITLCLTAIAFTLSASSFTTNRDANAASKNRRIEDTFNRHTTFDQLVEMKNNLHQKNIDLTFNKVEFDANQGLSKIAFSVNCNDGFKGSAGSNQVTNDSHIGFYRDYSKNSSSPFGTGEHIGESK